MLDAFGNLLKSFVEVLKYPIYFLIGLIGIMFLLIMLNIIIMLLKVKNLKG